MPALPILYIDPLHIEESSSRSYIISKAVHSSNGMEFIRPDIRTLRIDEIITNIDSEYQPQYHSRISDLDRRIFPAFEASRSLCDSWYRNARRRLGGKAGFVQFIDARRKINGANIH